MSSSINFVASWTSVGGKIHKNDTFRDTCCTADLGPLMNRQVKAESQHLIEPERRRKSIVSGIILFNIQYEWLFCSLLAFVHVLFGAWEDATQLAKYLCVYTYYTLNKKSEPNEPTFHCTLR